MVEFTQDVLLKLQESGLYRSIEMQAVLRHERGSAFSFSLDQSFAKSLGLTFPKGACLASPVTDSFGSTAGVLFCSPMLSILPYLSKGQVRGSVLPQLHSEATCLTYLALVLATFF